MFGEWQPIETAPEDVEVLVYVPSERPSVFTASNIAGWGRSVSEQYKPLDDHFGDNEFTPTKWMPLPAPPLS